VGHWHVPECGYGRCSRRPWLSLDRIGSFALWVRCPVKSGRGTISLSGRGSTGRLRPQARPILGETGAMTTLVLGLVGPVLGLLGVCLGIWYGQRRWRGDREAHHSDYYQTKRKEAYVGLWEVVQDAHLSMRESLTRTFSEDFAPFLTNVNAFVWKHGIYISDKDRDLAQEYLYTVYEFLRLVVNNEAAKHWIISSISFPEDTPSTLSSMKIAEDKANAVRDQLTGRIRTVIGGLPEQRVASRNWAQYENSREGQVLSARFKAFLQRSLEGDSPKLILPATNKAQSNISGQEPLPGIDPDMDDDWI